MSCDQIQQALSERLDAPTVDDPMLDRHVAGCADCRAFLDGALAVRSHLRVTPLDDDVPDVMAALVGRLDPPHRPAVRSRWRTVASVAASVVVGMLVGGLLVSGTGRAPVVADELRERLLAAQSTVTSFDAAVTIEEHGWHPDVPSRRYEGRLGYRSPEQLVVELDDITRYPDGRWTPNDVTRVVTTAHEWSTALAGCPTVQLPDCMPATPRTVGVDGRMPFSGDGAGLLDVVVPVDSFRLGGGTDLGIRTTDDGELVGVRVDVAQVAPLLDGLVGAGNWRALHPADPVELWVDAATLTPRELTVRAGSGAIRDQWAAQRGLTDQPNATLLHIELDPTRPDGRPLPSPPAGLAPMGFVDGPVDLPTVALPDGMRLHRTGIQPTSTHQVTVAAWTDGRAWVRLRTVDRWETGRLFGDLGPLVRRHTLDDGRTVYVGTDGRAVAIHTTGRQWLIDGSLGEDQLVGIAASLPADGRPVPAGWAETAVDTLASAARTLDGLKVPTGLDGFGPPAVQVHDDLVVLGYAGSGGRELLITQRPGAAVAPPVVENVIGVEVRGLPGRYLPDSGELEWVEDATVISVQSVDLGLDGLLEVATSMQAVP